MATLPEHGSALSRVLRYLGCWNVRVRSC